MTAMLTIGALLVYSVLGINFKLERSEKFCLGVDAIIGDNLVGAFRYDRNQRAKQQVTLSVTDTLKRSVYDSSDSSGSFEIAVDRDGLYEFCFYNPGRSLRSVSFEISDQDKDQKKTGVTKKHVDSLQDQMEMLLMSAKHLTKDIEHLKEQEWELRDLNEIINARVVNLGFFAIGTFIAVGAVKVYYLEGFFSKKKVI